MLTKAMGLHRSGNRDAAESIYKQLIALNPYNYHAVSLLATVYAQRGNFVEAITLMDDAIAINPAQVETYYNRGLAKQMLGQYENALADYVKATEVDPNYAEAYWHRSLVLLTLGHYSEGWKLYEWRWKRLGQGKFKTFQKPLQLDKDALAGKTIILHAEQGFGDTIQFCRYIPIVAENNEVVFVCPAALAPLMHYNFPYIRVHGVADKDPYPEGVYECDYEIPLMSLPMVFGTRSDTIPFGESAYLGAQPEYITKWKLLLSPLISEASLRIGVCWAGGQRPDNPAAMGVDSRRSLKFGQIKKILDIENAVFVSLQLGSRAKEIDDGRIKDFSGEIENWSDTAALISLLDIVVTVDTSVCHMAAAMGKKTLLLNRYDTCWRWLLERNDSPWYPTLTQYRQKIPGHWDDVIDDVCIVLKNCL